MWNTIVKVFSRIKYIIISLFISFIMFAFFVWLPNLKLIKEIISNSSISLMEKINFITSLLGSIQTNFTFISATYTIVIAILFGINLSLLIYYIRVNSINSIGTGVVSSIGGFISGVFGIGCAACGTFVLSSLLGLIGAVGFLSFLPFGGEEFGFLGVGLLIYSIYLILKKISKPNICSIK